MLASNNYCPKSRPFPQQNIFLLEGGKFYDICFKLDLRSFQEKLDPFPLMSSQVPLGTIDARTVSQLVF